VPRGSKHLPQERIRGERTLTSTAIDASVYVEEAMRWLPEESRDGYTARALQLPALPGPATARILLADDNVDMRDYVSRLLMRSGYEVETAADGMAALEAARREPPDLILSDVMMPLMDGFKLLRELRADSITQSLPVILLSARAGEEARAEGLHAGADDYLTKPFTARDLLMRVAAQVRLAAIRREGELRFRALADTAPAMLWITDRNNECTYLSRGWREYTGQSDQEGLGSGWLSVVHPADRDRAGRIFSDAAKRQEPFAFDYRLLNADGKYRWAIDAGHPRYSGEGRFLGYIGSVMDVHERKLAEQSLREADRRKDEFLAMLGHELRNPLAAIRNAASLVAMVEEPRLQAAQAILDRQTTHMARLVDGLLDVSRIARGKIDLTKTTIDLGQLIASVVQAREAEAKAEDLQLRYEAPAAPVFVIGDAIRLNQVFDNILGNAVKFSERCGLIDIAIELVGGDAVVTVRDTGMGIGADMLEAIFEPFRQGKQDYARAAGGIGLGLALVKRLVKLHRGEVTAHSEGPGRGASFRVALPQVDAPPHETPEKSGETVSPQRILLVEDNSDAAQALALLLAVRGHQTAIAGTATDALALLQKDGADIVLCDIGLPGMSGYDFARAVRADEALRSTKLVAVTGYGQPEDREQSRAAGFDAHLTKPVEVAALDGLLRAP
jgi:PAS domain S-box-containing protein